MSSLTWLAMTKDSLFMTKNNLHNLSGEKKDQLLIVCDREGNKLTTATREKCHQGDGIVHLAFLAFILDKDSKVILTKRSKHKSLWAGFWDASFVSHILQGETVQQACARRVKEELGITVNGFSVLGGFYYSARQEDQAENEYCHVLIGKTKGQADPNPLEIDDIKSKSVAELKQEVEKKPDRYTPWLKIALEKFDISSFL